MDRIVCPNCGEVLGTIKRLRDLVVVGKEFSDQCMCGEEYHITLSTDDQLLLRYSDGKGQIIW
jgi:hypothetical protein